MDQPNFLTYIFFLVYQVTLSIFVLSHWKEVGSLPYIVLKLFGWHLNIHFHGGLSAYRYARFIKTLLNLLSIWAVSLFNVWDPLNKQQLKNLGRTLANNILTHARSFIIKGLFI